jgi:hypothetical protein
MDLWTVSKPAARRLSVFVCGLALTLAACSEGGTPSTSGTSAAPTASAGTAAVSDALCADVAALRASLDKLRNVTVAPGLANEIRSDLDEVRSNLSAFVNDARGRWQAQTDALKAALDALGTAVNNLVASPGPGTVSAVQTARAAVNAAGRDLLDAPDLACPSAAPSPSG